jgi:uncharacterized protein YggE
MKKPLIALALLAAAVPAGVGAQQVEVQLPPIAGTRLDISATGETSRVPDIAIISAGVVTRAPTAAAAIQQNSARVERMLAALRRAGVEERDIQTSSINLNPDYHYEENRPPRLIAYQATNTLNIRFRDIANSGRILDALVAEGANQINGPTLTLDRPEAALDEARTNAIARGRARAELYARAMGMRVVRVVSVSESGGYAPPPPMPMAERAMAVGGAADTKIVPGEQKLQVTLAIVFELR